MSEKIKLPQRCENTALLNEEGLLTCECPEGWEYVFGARLWGSSDDLSYSEWKYVFDYDPSIIMPDPLGITNKIPYPYSVTHDYYVDNIYNKFKLIIKDADYYYIKVYVNLAEDAKDIPMWDNKPNGKGTKKDPYKSFNTTEFIEPLSYTSTDGYKFGGVLVEVHGNLTDLHIMTGSLPSIYWTGWNIIGDGYSYYSDYIWWDFTNCNTKTSMMYRSNSKNPMGMYNINTYNLETNMDILAYSDISGGFRNTIHSCYIYNCKINYIDLTTCMPSLDPYPSDFYIPCGFNFIDCPRLSVYVADVPDIYKSYFYEKHLSFIQCPDVLLTWVEKRPAPFYAYRDNRYIRIDSSNIVLTENSTLPSCQIQFIGGRSTFDLSLSSYIYFCAKLNLYCQSEEGVELIFSETFNGYDPYDNMDPEHIADLPEIEDYGNRYLYLTGVFFNCELELPDYVVLGYTYRLAVVNYTYNPDCGEDPYAAYFEMCDYSTDTMLYISIGAVTSISNSTIIPKKQFLYWQPESSNISVPYYNITRAENSTFTLERLLYPDSNYESFTTFRGCIKKYKDNGDPQYKGYNWGARDHQPGIVGHMKNNNITIYDYLTFYENDSRFDFILSLSSIRYTEKSAYDPYRLWDDCTDLEETELKIAASSKENNIIQWNMELHPPETPLTNCTPYIYYVWDPFNTIQVKLITELDCQVIDLDEMHGTNDIKKLTTIKLNSFPCKKCDEYDPKWCPNA